MSDAFVHELELIVAALERFGKNNEAQYVKEVIAEYRKDVTVEDDSEDNLDQCAQA